MCCCSYRGHTCRGGGKECFDKADQDVKFNKTKIQIDSCSLFHQVKSAKCLLTSEDALWIQTNSFVPLASGLKILRVAEAGQSQFKSENGKEESLHLGWASTQTGALKNLLLGLSAEIWCIRRITISFHTRMKRTPGTLLPLTKAFAVIFTQTHATLQTVALWVTQRRVSSWNMTWPEYCFL